MNSHFNKPIRTYGREKFRKTIITKPKLVTSILDDDDNKNMPFFNQKVTEFEMNEVVDNSMNYNLFDTTFDRLVKNARILPKSSKTNDSISFINSDSSCMQNTNKSGMDMDEPLLQKSNGFNNKSISSKKKLKQKPRNKIKKFTVTKKTLVKKKNSILQNSGQFKVHEDNFYENCKTNKTRDRKKIKSRNLKIKPLNERSESAIELKNCETPRNIGCNKKELLWQTEDNNDATSVESVNNIQLKQCSPVLQIPLMESVKCDEKNDKININNLESNKCIVKECFVKIEKLNNPSIIQLSSRKEHTNVVSSTPIGCNKNELLWQTEVNDDITSVESVNNIQLKQCSPVLQIPLMKSVKCDEKNDKININNLESNKYTKKECFVKIEKLEDPSIIQFSSKKKHTNVVSSTPKGKSLRLSNLIALSPIPVYCSQDIKYDNSQIITYSTAVTDNNAVSSQPLEIESVLQNKLGEIEKCDINKEAKVLSICDTHSPKVSKCNFVTSENVNKTDINSLLPCEYNINIHDKQKSLMKAHSVKSDVSNESIKSSISLEMYSISNAKGKKQQLNFSVDTNGSRSLFDDSNGTMENILPRENVANNKREDFISPFVLCTKSETSNGESTVDSIKLSRKSILKVACNKTQEEVSNVLCSNSLILLNDVQNKSDVEEVDFENTNTLNIVNYIPPKKNNALTTNNSILATINNYDIAPFPTVLKQLEQPGRITARRKYTKWDRKLHSIAEDYNNSTDTKKKLTLTKVNKSKRTVLSQRILTSLENIMDESVNNTSVGIEKPIFLKPGKSWARSLSILNNVQNESNLEKLSIGKGQKWSHSVRDVLSMQKQGIIQSCIKGNDSDKELHLNDETVNKSEEKLIHNKGRTSDSTNLIRVSRRISVRVVPIHKPVKSIEDAPFLEAYGIVPVKNQRVTLLNKPQKYSTCDVQTDNIDGKISDEHVISTAKEVILQKCLQIDYIPFSTYFSDSYLKFCRKIGEGVYGEVFLYEEENTKSVIKIIPIEGSEYVNGEPQKKFHEILSEIVIAMELHNLRFNANYNTDGFVEVKNIKCIKGRYPQKLVELWNIYDEEKRSDNDCPSMFDDDQLYILLELGHGGQDLEAFIFNTAEEAHILFIQAALALAVAEKAVQFEHRDLHWGNVLISSTNESCLYYKLGEKNIELISKGVKVSIIDFTLSRVTYQGCSVFNDLASDPTLFTAQGEYQFEIYRLMRDKVKNDWQQFEPYTNILWLHYTLDKMITAVRYRKKNLKIHKNGIAKLNELKSIILTYDSVFDFVTKCDKIVNLLCINSEAALFEREVSILK